MVFAYFKKYFCCGEDFPPTYRTQRQLFSVMPLRRSIFCFSYILATVPRIAEKSRNFQLNFDILNSCIVSFFGISLNVELFPQRKAASEPSPFGQDGEDDDDFWEDEKRR